VEQGPSHAVSRSCTAKLPLCEPQALAAEGGKPAAHEQVGKKAGLGRLFEAQKMPPGTPQVQPRILDYAGGNPSHFVGLPYQPAAGCRIRPHYGESRRADRITSSSVKTGRQREFWIKSHRSGTTRNPVCGTLMVLPFIALRVPCRRCVYQPGVAPERDEPLMLPAALAAPLRRREPA
jgi:hypothetical protein